MKLVIIEDEKVTANDLKQTIVSIDHSIKIEALLHSVEESIEFFSSNTDIDLIFSDIQLGDGLSFDIFKQLNMQTPIIFCTAYNMYFSEAFQTVGIDYLLKPFSKQTVEKSLQKFTNLKNRLSRGNDDYKGLFDLIEQKMKPKKSSVIIHREKIIPLESDNIAFVYVDHGNTFAFTFELEKFVINDNMEDMEQAFSPGFFRANRQFLVNRKAIKDATQYFNRKVLVNLVIPFKGQILVGKLKTSAFINWLSKQ
jgi:two-component system, LytTR family, response regulator LytT